MPTVLLKSGWRFFFYANEGNEPVHIHCQKGNSNCKYWLDTINFDILEAYIYDMSARDKRFVRQVIFENFDYIVLEWDKFARKKDGKSS